MTSRSYGTLAEQEREQDKKLVDVDFLKFVINEKERKNSENSIFTSFHSQLNKLKSVRSSQITTN